MAQEISNLYVSRVAADHPIALWQMDESHHFLSLINASARDVSGWNLDYLTTASSAIVPPYIKIDNNQYTVLTLTSAQASQSASYDPFQFIDPDNIMATATLSPSYIKDSIDPDKKSISISSFVLDFPGYVEYYYIGFIFTTDTGQTIDWDYFSNKGSNKKINEWRNVYYTTTVPDNLIDVSIIIGFEYDKTLNDSGSDYNVAISGVTVGQHSEEFHYSDLGSNKDMITDYQLLSLVSSSAAVESSRVTHNTIDTYGISSASVDNGYYLILDNKLLSFNKNFPMTYGAQNSTVLVPTKYNIPGLIFPGKGFLNSTCRYQNFTVEFWLKVYSKSSNSKRIFGPLGSKDGIYINKEYITVKVGKYTKSHFIGKWGRPMLVDFSYSLSNIYLFINGDLVINMLVDNDKIDLPDETKDYIGFYNNDLEIFEVDCVTIFPYVVQQQSLKKRFIYAQGVISFENISDNFKGESFTTDFRFAKYTSTLNYPDNNDWSAGFLNNLSTTSRYLGTVQYNLPEILFTTTASNAIGVTIEDFIDDNTSIQDADYPFIKLSPSSNFDDISTGIYFSNLNMLNNEVKSFFGVFRSPETLSSQKETILTIINNVNNDNFQIKISNAGLEYFYNSNLIYVDNSVVEDSIFIAGFNIDSIVENFYESLSSFFYNLQNLSMTIGGTSTDLFTGKIYSITFNNLMFTNKDLGEYISSNGFFNSKLTSLDLIRYIGNYTFYPKTVGNTLVLDIGSTGYWEDSVPLSYFADYYTNNTGKKIYDLDFIQFNIESPSEAINKKDTIKVLDGGSVTEEDYDIFFNANGPSASIINFEFNGGSSDTITFDKYLSEEDLLLAYKIARVNNDAVKIYMTIQNYKDLGTIPYSSYTNIERVGGDRVLDLNTITNYETTKFEIVDNSIIFTPKDDINFEQYYITIHIELKTESSNNAPVFIKKMLLSSLTLNETTPKELSSSSGFKMYPFSRNSLVYLNKAKNPFTFYRDSTSYMYATQDSGISVLPYDNGLYRGVTFPINQKKATNYSLGGLQFWINYNADYIFSKTTKFGSLKLGDTYYEFWIVPEYIVTTYGIFLAQVYLNKFENNLDPDNNPLPDFESDRGLIFIRENGQLPNTFIFNFGQRNKVYQNGILVNNPYIRTLSWNTITLSLDESINVSNAEVGQFEIYENVLINNISFYGKETDILGKAIRNRRWNVIDEAEWQSWYDDGTWLNELQETVSTIRDLDGESVYNTTFGIQSAIASDDTGLIISTDTGLDLLSNVIWETTRKQAV